MKYFQFGSAVETLSLKMMIKGLTSDINQCESNKKSRAKRTETESRLANGFSVLSEILAERVSIAREAVLTGFSICPTKEKLDKIRQLAKISGLDKLCENDAEEEKYVENERQGFQGIHCRVTSAGKFSRSKNSSSSEGSAVEGRDSTANVFSAIDSELNLEEIFRNINDKMSNNPYGRAKTKLRTHKRKNKKKFRNLDGLLAIQVIVTISPSFLADHSFLSLTYLLPSL